MDETETKLQKEVLYLRNTRSTLKGYTSFGKKTIKYGIRYNDLEDTGYI
jgi:hypothetical protein